MCQKNRPLKKVLIGAFLSIVTYNAISAHGLTREYVQSLLSAQQQLPFIFRARVIDFLQQPDVRGALYERPSRWYTCLWQDLASTPDRPSFAPACERELRAQGWGNNNGAAFNDKVARARSTVELVEEHHTVYATLAQRHNLAYLGTNRHSIIVRFKQFPDYIVKLLRNKWALPFQLISQVFWAHSIKQAIAQHPSTATHIICPDTYLLHRSGMQTYTPNDARTALRDDNYVVVQAYQPDVPSYEINQRRIHALDPATVVAVATIIKAVGIWDVSESTLFFIPTKKGKKVVGYKAFFSHLECPGHGGYTFDDFYQQTPAVTARLAQQGLAGLAAMLPPHLRDDETVKAALTVMP